MFTISIYISWTYELQLSCFYFVNPISKSLIGIKNRPFQLTCMWDENTSSINNLTLVLLNLVLIRIHAHIRNYFNFGFFEYSNDKSLRVKTNVSLPDIVIKVYRTFWIFFLNMSLLLWIYLTHKPFICLGRQRERIYNTVMIYSSGTEINLQYTYTYLCIHHAIKSFIVSYPNPHHRSQCNRTETCPLTGITWKPKWKDLMMFLFTLHYLQQHIVEAGSDHYIL